MHKENREMKLIKKIMTNTTAHRERKIYIHVNTHLQTTIKQKCKFTRFPH